MLTPRQLADHLRRSSLEVKFAAEREVRLAMEAAAVEAKALIGREAEEWAPLAPRTIAEKQRLGYTGAISETDPLLRTGALRDSLHGEAEAVSGEVIGRMGSSDPVAVDQEFGTSRIPPRPFIAPSMISATVRLTKALTDLGLRALTPGETP